MVNKHPQLLRYQILNTLLFFFKYDHFYIIFLKKNFQLVILFHFYDKKKCIKKNSLLSRYFQKKKMDLKNLIKLYIIELKFNLNIKINLTENEVFLLHTDLIFNNNNNDLHQSTYP